MLLHRAGCPVTTESSVPKRPCDHGRGRPNRVVEIDLVAAVAKGGTIVHRWSESSRQDLHEPDKFLCEPIVGSNPTLPKFPTRMLLLKTPIAGRQEQLPRANQPGTVLKMTDVLAIGLVKSTSHRLRQRRRHASHRLLA